MSPSGSVAVGLKTILSPRFTTTKSSFAEQTLVMYRKVIEVKTKKEMKILLKRQEKRFLSGR